MLFWLVVEMQMFAFAVITDIGIVDVVNYWQTQDAVNL